MSKLTKSAMILGVVVLMLLGIGSGNIKAPVKPEEGRGLFIDVIDSDILANYATAGDSEAPIDPTIVRSRLVNINWDIFAMTGDLPESEIVGGDVLLLNLFTDSSFTANLDHWEARSGNNFTWIGYIDGDEGSQVTIVVQDDVMVGNIRVSGESYQVRYIGEDVHVIREIDERFFPPEGEPISVDNPSQGFDSFLSPAAFQGETAADDGSTLDVMVVYTERARSEAGGTTAMNALIILAVTETNTAFSNSGVTPRVRLVHSEEVSYTESSDLSTDLSRLALTADGFMDNVHTLRNTHRADMVSLFVEGGDGCGRAFVMFDLSNAFEPFAFSAVRQECATGIFVFGHELGHNMGLQHDRANQPNDGVFPYSHGYVDDEFSTIMAIASGRIQNFSNPSVSFEGDPTGVDFQAADSADAARSLNNTAFTVANWRVSGVGDLVVEALQVSPSNVTAGENITVSYNIANRGTGIVTENYTEKVHLSTNNTLDGTDVLIATSSPHTTDLPVNATFFNSVTIPIPTGTALGSYFILVEADALAVVAESDESNNVTAIPLTVTGPLLTVNKAGSGSGTVTSSPAGINCGSDCSESFTKGKIVTLTATLAVASVFGGWNGGGCSGTGSCILTINADTTVTATFSISSFTFTDEPLNSGTTAIKRVHITELRNAADQLRAQGGLAAFSFTDPTLTANVTTVKGVHITDLRTALTQAALALGKPTPTFSTDPTIVAGQTVIKKSHIEEIRTAIRALESLSAN